MKTVEIKRREGGRRRGKKGKKTGRSDGKER